MKVEDILSEAADISDSKIIDVLDKNQKLTDRRGGEVRASIVGRGQLSVAIGDFKDDDMHWIKGSLGKNGKWKIKEVRGEGVKKVIKKKTVSDEEMAAAVQAVFDFAKKKR